MREVLNIINQISATSGRNDKEDILKEHKDNKQLLDIFKFVYNPFIITGLSAKKMNKDTNLQHSIELNTFEEVIQYVKLNNTGKDIDIANVHHFIYKHDKEMQDFYKQVFTKNLKIGLTSSTLNKVYGDGFIKDFEVMLAKKYEDHYHKIKGDFVITKKLDGSRLVVVKNNGVVNSFTRQGKPYEGLEEIESDIANLSVDNIVFDGEILADTEDFADTISKSRSKGSNKTGLLFYIFDMLPLDEFQAGKSKDNAVKRKSSLSELFSKYDLPHCKEVKPLYVGNDLSQVESLMQYATSQKWEGLMINLDKPYVCKRSDCILKVKTFKEADVRVLDVIEGTNKNVGKVGSITIQFEHEGNIYECNCGSGFSDEERVKYWQNPELILGKIVTVGYFEVSKNQGGGYGLRFPTWQSIIRDDKDEISMH